MNSHNRLIRTVETLLENDVPLEASNHPGNGAPATAVLEEAVETPPGSDGDVLDLLGRTHALTILRAVTLAREPRRFSDLEAELDVSPSTLSARLSAFVDAGLLERRSYDEMPPRVEYRPTEKGEALAPLFLYLRMWEERYGLE